MVPETLSLFLIVPAVFLAALSFLAFRKARAAETTAVAVLLGGIALVAFGCGVELLHRDVVGKALGKDIFLIGCGLSVSSFFVLALWFVGEDLTARPWRMAALLALPLLAAVAAGTNSLHHLVYSAAGNQIVDGIPVLILAKGPLYWPYVFILIGYPTAAVIALTRGRLRIAKRYRRAAAILAWGGLPPIAAAFLYVAGWRIAGVIHPVPPFLVLTGLIYYFALLRKDLADLRPLARDRLMERFPDGIMVIDATGIIVDANAQAVRLLGCGGVVGRREAEVLEPITGPRAQTGDVTVEVEHLGRILELRTAPLTHRGGDAAGTVLQIHDATVARRAELALAASLKRESQLGVLGRHLSVTQQLDELPNVALPLVADIMDADFCFMALSVDGLEIAAFWSRESGMVEPVDGELITMEHSLSLTLDARGAVVGSLKASRSRPFDPVDEAVGETARWMLANAISNTLLLLDMERAARTDPLTGLDNRASFIEAGEREVMLANRHGRSLCVAMCDLDHFKAVNDRFGHAIGDSVLVEAAHRIAQATRSTDLVCRWGGEEFAILMPEASLEAGRAVAERVRRCMEETPFELDAGAIPVRISIGVAAFDRESGEWLSALTDRADRALYMAKGAGRNRVMVDQTSAG